MSNATFLEKNSDFPREQIIKTIDGDDKQLDASTLICSKLSWIRDEGRYSIMEATEFIPSLRIDQTRKGRYAGSIILTILKGQTVSILINNGSGNHDHFSC